MCVPQHSVSTVTSLLERMEDSKEADLTILAIARCVAAVLRSNSVYQEVRAIVPPSDNVEEPTNTIRMWVIGLIWAGGLSALNQFFYPRQPTITVAVYLAQLFGFVMGKAAATFLPSKVFFQGSRFAFTLNPGPWSMKEQTLVTIMSNVSYMAPVMTELFFIQRLDMYLGLEWAADFGYGLCMLLSSQLLGFGLAGLCRRFLVHPPHTLWYFVLGQTAMNRAFIQGENPLTNGWRISRMKYFFVVFACAWCYYWIPNTMFPTLTFFNWITWIKPTSAVVALVTGSYYFNLGFNPLSSFDYQWFSTVDPFVTPFFIVVQMVGSTAFWGICVIIPVFFSNTWDTGYLPINSWLPYDNTGAPYQAQLILGQDHKFNQTAYEQYSPLLLPAAFVLRWAGMMALLPAMPVFVYLWHRKLFAPIFQSWFKSDAHTMWENDVHYRLMSRYKEAPHYVYGGIAIIAMALGIAGVYAWPVGVPWWIFPVVFILSGFFVIPVGLLTGVAGYATDLDFIFSIIGGYAVPGDPVSIFVFKSLGKCVLRQATYFLSDMKLGHYNKIPPRLMLASQVIATIVSVITSLGIIKFQLTGIPGICNPVLQPRWICGNVAQSWTTSIVWGALGPSRLFGSDALYKKLPWSVLAGVLWPVVWYLARQRWPNSVFRLCHPLVLLVGPILWAPLNFSMVWQGLPVSFVFGYWIKYRYVEWWNKYNYITSTALLSGIAFSIIIQFVALANRGITFPQWWGTTQYMNTCDFKDCRWLTVTPGEPIGPAEWH
ncbi:OPT oligopeptide transporter protein-domain-containing protein [Ilyonectria sp. MPI-CAGE-AT-0026]|nr:OPT oligopeptide transporter protein-domain-containing protein [Ilyonectria sp. MPI-CAGE-AT-0026]